MDSETGEGDFRQADESVSWLFSAMIDKGQIEMNKRGKLLGFRYNSEYMKRIQDFLGCVFLGSKLNSLTFPSSPESKLFTK